MSANLLYLTSNTERSNALLAICVEENYTLTVCAPEAAPGKANYDLVFCDAEISSGFDPFLHAVPVVAVYDSSSSVLNTQTLAGAIDFIAFPFVNAETIVRLRCLSRLHMLQEELAHTSNNLNLKSKISPVLVIGNETTRSLVMQTLSGGFEVEGCDDDLTGLLRAAQGNWSCVVLALSESSRDPIAMIRQMRVLDRTRTTPVLVFTQNADARCVSALHAGANDMVLEQRSPFELVKRVEAMALRKAVIDALRAEAASIAPLSDFDHTTGLPGPTQLARSMPASLERLKAQGKPASLLLIAVDPIIGVAEAEPVSDHVMLALTQVLRRSLRGFDFACRFSRDCFAILMPGADAKGAQAVAERICAEIKSEKVRLKDGRKDGTTASIGLATISAASGAISADQIIAAALESLAKAQANGAAQIVAQELSLAA
ncbi:MAG: diguanylate cyclase [Notoacmeibacter sp.]